MGNELLYTLDSKSYGKLFKRFEISTCHKIKLFFMMNYSCCLSKKERHIKKLIEKGEDKLTKALDIQTIIR